MKPSGAHVHDDGGSPLPLLAIAALVLLASGAAAVLAEVLVLIAIATVATAVLAAAGGVAWLVHQSRREAPGRAISVRRVSAHAPGVSGASQRAIGAQAPREIHNHNIHLYGVTAAELAAAIVTAQRQGTGPGPGAGEEGHGQVTSLEFPTSSIDTDIPSA